MTTTPFSIHVADAVLIDLDERLARARLLDDSPRRPSSGMNAEYLAELVTAWRAFDWRARESYLNSYPQYIADVEGSALHFVHRRAVRSDAPALLVMHGWPHTYALQLALVDALPDFHVVVPSLPGFGFSAPYASDAMTETRLADTFVRLMHEELGYERFLTYGEDVTANVSDLIAASRPDVVAGIIATHAHFPTAAERAELTDPTERDFFAGIADFHELHGAYGHVQSTRPDTLAAALNDSPAGLLAWLVEKLVEWSDTSPTDPAHVETRLSRDRLLTEAMIYWSTESIASSFRPYYEGADTPDVIDPVDVPAAVFIQRHEADYPSSLARRFYRDLRVFERLDEGGHFTAGEVPGALAARIRAFAGELRLLPAV